MKNLSQNYFFSSRFLYVASPDAVPQRVESQQPRLETQKDVNEQVKLDLDYATKQLGEIMKKYDTAVTDNDGKMEVGDALDSVPADLHDVVKDLVSATNQMRTYGRGEIPAGGAGIQNTFDLLAGISQNLPKITVVPDTNPGDPLGGGKKSGYEFQIIERKTVTPSTPAALAATPPVAAEKNQEVVSPISIVQKIKTFEGGAPEFSAAERNMIRDMARTRVQTIDGNQVIIDLSTDGRVARLQIERPKDTQHEGTTIYQNETVVLSTLTGEDAKKTRRISQIPG